MKKLLFSALLFFAAQLLHAASEQNMCIIIPAYNEAERIGFTIDQYAEYFNKRADILVVMNGCTDNTQEVVRASEAFKTGILNCLELEQAGKGYAVTQGFLKALEGPYDMIGFVDADCATMPAAFDHLIQKLNQDKTDGIIASRYMQDAQSSQRPITKEWGRKLCFLPLVSCLYGLDYQDTQCGAKLFTRKVIERIAPQMRQPGWSFDIELLYLARQEGFSVIEVPTIWEDQPGSHLDTCSGGIPMILSLFCLR